MRLTILYKEKSDHAREVATFVEMMRRLHPDKDCHLTDVETRSGAATASLYGIVQYPAILVTAYDGSVQSLSEGLPLPRVDEIAGQLHTQSFSV